MAEQFARLQKTFNKMSKRDWKKQNLLNMTKIYQSELVQDGLQDIWGKHTGTCVLDKNGLLEFVPADPNDLKPVKSVDSYDDFLVMDHLDNLEAFSRQQPVVDSRGMVVNSTVSPRSQFVLPSFLNPYARMFRPGTLLVQVQFKYTCRDYWVSEHLINTSTKIEIGTLLIVKSHIDSSQQDLGVAVRLFTPTEYIAHKAALGESADPDENFIGEVVRVAYKKDSKALAMKHNTESKLLGACQSLAVRHALPVVVYGVEFQFDGLNLFVYFTVKSVGFAAPARLSFDAYARDLMLDCPSTRIVMKDTTNSRPFAPDPIAERKLKKM